MINTAIGLTVSRTVGAIHSQVPGGAVWIFGLLLLGFFFGWAIRIAEENSRFKTMRSMILAYFIVLCFVGYGYCDYGNGYGFVVIHVALLAVLGYYFYDLSEPDESWN